MFHPPATSPQGSWVGEGGVRGGGWGRKLGLSGAMLTCSAVFMLKATGNGRRRLVGLSTELLTAFER